jgi:glycosyltransferase involved in cell wall biosynthesis
VAISRWLADWARDESTRIGCPVDIIQIPILVDVAEQSAEETVPPRGGFVYAASNEYSRDLAFLLECMRRVWRSHPDAVLTVTGMRPAQVADFAWRLGLSAAVAEGQLRSTGYLERRALLAEYQGATALLIPLHEDLKSLARFPSKIGEYLASGRPVVTSRVGEVERFLEDGRTAYLAVPGDVVSFANLMVTVLDDVSSADAVGKAGRGVAEDVFSCSVHADAFVGFLWQIRHGRVPEAGLS